MTASGNTPFAHAMLAEIYEQPQALRATLAAFTEGDRLRTEAFAGAANALEAQSLLIAASGSSRHAGLVGKVLLEQLAGLNTQVEYASEHTGRSNQKPAAMLVLSQSGETADTLEALRMAGAGGAATIAITNHAQSAMSRLADCSLTTRAGLEKAIPATKSFTTQLMVLELLALFAAQLRGRLTPHELAPALAALRKIPDAIERGLPQWDRHIAASAALLDHAQNVLFLGRGIHFPIAAEGALKLKESAYLGAEAYPAGELKHGPAALLGEHAVLVALTAVDRNDPDSLLRQRKTEALLAEMQARAVPVLAIGHDLPATHEHLLPLLEVVPLQLLAYHAAIRRGIDVDHPRNLAKAVLVE